MGIIARYRQHMKSPAVEEKDRSLLLWIPLHIRGDVDMLRRSRRAFLTLDYFGRRHIGLFVNLRMVVARRGR